jgi:hypothetical protein
MRCPELALLWNKLAGPTQSDLRRLFPVITPDALKNGIGNRRGSCQL